MRLLWSFARIRLDALVASRSSYIRLKARADRLRDIPVERPESLPSTAAPSYSSEFMHIHRSVAVAAVQYASLASRYDPCSVRNLWSAAASASRAPSRSAGVANGTAEKSGPVQSVRNRMYDCTEGNSYGTRTVSWTTSENPAARKLAAKAALSAKANAVFEPWKGGSIPK